MPLDFSFLQDWPPPLESTFWIALLLVIAPLTGEAVFRYWRWPRIVGYTLVGVGASLAGIDTANLEFSPDLRWLMEVALAVLLFELGNRIHPRWIIANPWLIAGSLAEAGFTFAVVYGLVIAFGFDQPSAIAIAAISLVSSPAVIMRVAAELNARGQVTERILLFCALNTIYATLIIHALSGFLTGMPSGAPDSLLQPAWMFSSSLLLAAVLAATVGITQRKLDLADENGALLLLGILFLSLTIVDLVDASPLLVPLLAGIALRSRDPRPRPWPRHFGTAGGVLVVLFFVASGMSIDWPLVAGGGGVSLLLLALRTTTKVGGCLLFGRLSGLSLQQAAALGIALLPMSGLAFLLTASLHATLPELGRTVASVLAGAMAMMELVGPLATQWALKNCHEAGPEARQEGHRHA